MSTKANETRLNIRIDPQLKAQASAVAGDMGIDLSTVVKLTLTQMVKDRRLPFTPTALPTETLKAIDETKHPEKLETYDTDDDMWRNLGV